MDDTKGVFLYLPFFLWFLVQRLYYGPLPFTLFFGTHYHPCYTRSDICMVITPKRICLAI